MIFQKIEGLNIDYDKLVHTYEQMNLEELFNKDGQLAVQCRPETKDENQLYESLGSLLLDWDNFDSTIHDKVQQRANPLKQWMFTKLCDLFKGTYIEEVVNIVNAYKPVIRTRIMQNKPKTCLSIHEDPTPRIHIPLITNDHCFMVVGNQVLHLPYGGIYLVDTTVMHTAVNASLKKRTHMVFCCKDFK